MRKLKILIVTRYFFPENNPRAFRATELVKEFSRQGHDVTLITSERNLDYNSFFKSTPFNFLTFGALRFKSLTKSSNRLIGDWPRKIGRLLYFLFNYPDIELVWRVRRALLRHDGYDLLISIAVPHPVHWGTALARRKKQRIADTWVADCGDPYYLNTLESYRLPLYFAWIEKWFCRKADYITIPFEALIDYFFPEFHEKIRIIPQGFDFSEIERSNVEPTNPKPKFAYAGGVANSGVRSPMKLINLLMTFSEDFEFHIYAATGHELVLPFENISKNKIVTHSPISRGELLPQLSKMDFLVNLYTEGTSSKQVPSKLIDYGLTGRPILNVDPVNPDENSIRRFINKDYGDSFIIDNIQRYNIKNVVKDFLDLVGHKGKL